MRTINLPANYGPERDQAILDRVRSGAYDPIRYGRVYSQAASHTAVFSVFADALSMDGVRINVSAQLAQQIADLLGSMLLTAKLADLLFLNRQIAIPPTPQPITSTTQGMEEHSGRIDDLLAQTGKTVGASDIVQTVGKHWILDNDTPQMGKYGERTACNYGWHFVGSSFGGISARAVTPGLFLIQDRGWAHDLMHADYSQTCVLVSQDCTVDGSSAKTADVLASPELAPLGSHQGPLRVLRQPLVPVAQPVAQGEPKVFLPLVPMSCPSPPAPPLAGSYVPLAKPYAANAEHWRARWARHPVWTVIMDTVAGAPVLARVECVQQGSASAPDVVLYAPADPNGHALQTPPPGWPGGAAG